MKIRSTAFVSMIILVFIASCINVYTSPTVSHASFAPELTLNSLESAVIDQAQKLLFTSGNAVKPKQNPVISLPDLIPTEIVYDESALAVGTVVFFDSGIINVGGTDADRFNIKWLVNGNEMGYGGHQGIKAGSKDMTYNSQFYWRPVSEGDYKIEFIVDCDSFIKESNEGNNSVFVNVSVGDEVWGETPIQLGDRFTLFDVYTEKAEVDLDGDGNLDRIEYHAGETLTINGGVYPSTHENYAQSFAIVDISQGDQHLEILLNPEYRALSGDVAEYPSSWFCWWDGEIIHGFGMKGLLFDGQWRDEFVPSNYFLGYYRVTFLTPLSDNSGYYWGDFSFDPVNYRFVEFH